MRKEPFTVGDYVHVFNRGNRKMPIVYNDGDRWRFLRILRYFNDEYSPENIFRELELSIKSRLYRHFEWPASWPNHKPIVKILSYHLTSNHFHLLLKEIIPNGVSKFMKKLGDGYTNYLNIKYKEVGKVFQGSYKSRTVKDLNYLQYLDAYIQVFNPFELYPGGVERALKEFDKAFEFAIEYPFSSLGESFRKRNLGIIDRESLEEMFPNLKIYKEFARDALLVRNIREILDRLLME